MREDAYGDGAIGEAGLVGAEVGVRDVLVDGDGFEARFVGMTGRSSNYELVSSRDGKAGFWWIGSLRLR